jgi:hypothetical protein
MFTHVTEKTEFETGFEAHLKTLLLYLHIAVIAMA